MNTKAPVDPAADDEIILPELTLDRQQRIEEAIFDRISEEAERPSTSHVSNPGAEPRRSRAPRRWLIAGSIAAAFVVGIVLPPALGQWTQEGVDSSAVADRPSAMTGLEEGAVSAPEAGSDAIVGQSAAGDGAREVITNGNARVRVDDIRAATDAITSIAQSRSGFVETLSIGSLGSLEYPGSSVNDASSNTAPAEASPDSGWISVRVPADQLTAVVEELSQVGDVLSTEVSTQDVTTTVVDLQARVDSLRASVARLTDLMEQAGSVGELLEAEGALSQRQAELESLEQQLTSVQSQVAMSSLWIDLSRAGTAESADPAGFGDGLLSGWNGLVSALNGFVVALGFLLPWLPVVAVIALIVWGIVRLRRRARRRAARPRGTATS